MKPANYRDSLCLANFPSLSAPPLVISLVGGGGKTSAAFWLAQQFKAKGHNVFVSTTTKMYLPDINQADYFISLEETEGSLITHKFNYLSEPGITFCYQALIRSNNKQEKNKVSGITPTLIDTLKNESHFTVFIIEADGAKRLPIKAPDRHEPCIPITSDMVIGVTGAEVIHTRAIPERIHRWNLFSALTQCNAGETIDSRVLGNLIEHRQGMFKQAPEQAIKIWLINKIDLVSDYQKVKSLAQHVISKTEKLDAIWLAAMNSHTPVKDVLMG